ncbi:MAG TPA: FecR domain-containing protein [Bacteroidales bacterium]|nr:FecR domain-containing protein [Bacteroidales bacterium]
MSIKIIVKKLTNVANQRDKERFDNLIARNPKKLEEYNMLEKIWHEAGNLQIFNRIDTASDWSAVQGRINPPLQSNYKPIRLQRYMLRVAAVLLLALGLSAGFYKLITSFGDSGQDFKRILAENSIQEVRLADGTLVTLNIGSTLTYRNDFNRNTREVVLEGEGLFDVVSNPGKPFKVYTGESVIEVTGTSFTIREDNGAVKVSVLSGTVLLARKNEQSNTLTVAANQSGYLLTTNELKLENSIEVNELSWKTGHLIFDETPLDSALFDIARHFRKGLTLETVIIEDITAEFQDQPLREILEELKQVSGLEFDTTGAALIVRK